MTAAPRAQECHTGALLCKLWACDLPGMECLMHEGEPLGSLHRYTNMKKQGLDVEYT